jgi:DNA-binding beta-propeller fold protein YncE
MLARLGRSEDVKFSPDNSRLVILGYRRNRILVVDARIRFQGSAVTIDLVNSVELQSSTFSEPHGVCFLDSTHVVVANRKGLASIVELPPVGGYDSDVMEANLACTITGNILGRLQSPGSVTASCIGNRRYELLFCNNLVHYVTRHTVDLNHGARVSGSRMLLRRWLDIPDGVATDKHGEWIAISNHNAHAVYVYRNAWTLNPYSKPFAILGGMHYPHGVCFTRDARFLFVADAGAPFVHVYARQGDTWRNSASASACFRLMDEDTFLRGRYNPQEGGPKGIDIDATGGLLAATSEHQGLAFFGVPEMTAASAGAAPVTPRAEAEPTSAKIPSAAA